jgi:hypothetical protein
MPKEIIMIFPTHPRSHFTALLSIPFLLASAPDMQAADESPLRTLEQLIQSEPKPFVVVEATEEDFSGRGQGVVISPQGHMLSVGHVCWSHKLDRFVDHFRARIRSSSDQPPFGATHQHKAIFKDREDQAFYEYLFNATLVQQAGSRFIDHRDLALFKIEAKGDMPFVEFYSDDRPELQVGDRLTLCHYIFPDREADPTFMLNPIEVVGVVQTPSGIQYLADGYCRYGSSGGAILKDGKLVGIQSSTYPVNAHEIGEIPIGLLSFHPVWRSLVAETLDTPAPDTTEPDTTEPDTAEPEPAADQP